MVRIWLPTVRASSGADVFVERLAAGLNQAGHEAIVDWFDRRYEFAPWLLQQAAPPPSTDVIHAGSWQGFAFKRHAIPLVVTEHNFIGHPDFVRTRGALRSIYHRIFIKHCVARTYGIADTVVAVSEFSAGPMRSALRKPVPVVHNWVDPRIFTPVVRKSRPPRAFRILVVGNPSPWKGSFDIPELASALGQRFEILSLGGLRKPARQSAANVRLLDAVPPSAMPGIYGQADAVAVLSRYESFGFVAAEAMACGLPVIGYAAGGTMEVCGDAGELLAPIGEVSRVADSARLLAADPGVCDRLGTLGRARVLRKFSPERAIAQYLDIYSGLLCPPTRRQRN